MTWQALVVGFSSESHSVKPSPARPSAKYHCLFTGTGGGGGGVLVAVGLGDGLGLGVGDGLGDGDGLGVSVGDGLDVGLETGLVGVPHGVGFVTLPGSASSRLSPNSSLIQILLLPSTASPSCGCELEVTHPSMIYI